MALNFGAKFKRPEALLKWRFSTDEAGLVRRCLVSGNLVHERIAGVQGVRQFNVALGGPGQVLRCVLRIASDAGRGRQIAAHLALGVADRVLGVAGHAACVRQAAG